jgi:hypothetical protein
MAGAFRTADATVAAHGAVPVTPSDSTEIPTTRALYVGVTGNLSVVMPDSDVTVVFSNVPVGIFPIQVTKVLVATTASSIVALY